MSAAGAASHIEAMTIPIVAEYDGYKHANPRAAMPGYREHQRVSLELPARTVDTADAPVAARIPGALNWVADDGYITEIRVEGGHLYRPLEYIGGLPITPENALLSPVSGLYVGCYETETQAREAVLQEAKDLILIDGELWARTVEPVLAVRGRNLRAKIEPNEFDTVYPLSRYQDAVDATRVTLDTSPRNLMLAPELLMPEVFSEPSAADLERAGADADQGVLAVIKLLMNPSSTTMREAATRLLDLARKYDADILPRELKKED